MNVAFSFAHKKPQAAQLFPAIVTGVDPSISQASVRLHDGTARVIGLERQDCSDALCDIVQRGGGAVRIECDVDGGRASSLRLVVDEENLDAALDSGHLAVEESLILLARNVWRESVTPFVETGDAEEMETVDERIVPWNPRYPLYPHQRRSVEWMVRHERSLPLDLTYAGNLRITGRWYLDTEGETFTTDPSPRASQVSGGICSDGMGEGKTATALRLIVSTLHSPAVQLSRDCDKYVSNATLAILPINLVSQWRTELDTFVPAGTLRVLWLVQGKEVKTLTMESLLHDYDLVLTTFHFLRASKPYLDMVEAALGGRARARPALSAWARQGARTDPVLEAVTWKRIVVDEVHDTLDNPRDLRQLTLFHRSVLWGITATPPVHDADQAQQLYLLLTREKSHHPNLLSSLIQRSVRCHTEESRPSASAAVHSLNMVQLSAEERLHLRFDESGEGGGNVVQRCMFVDPSSTDPSSVEEQFRAARTREQTTLQAKADGYERSLRILERAGGELEAELQRLMQGCADGDEIAIAQADATKAAYESHQQDMAVARQVWQAVTAKISRLENAESKVSSRMKTLHRRDACSGGGPRCKKMKCTIFSAQCAHFMCQYCADALECPVCKAHLDPNDLSLVSGLEGIGTKLSRIGEQIVSIGEAEPVILFVQWKQMVRGTKCFLRSLGLRVFLLDGNAAHRATALHEFTNGGVLLLCLEECFAGLHLPHVQHVIFAHAIVGGREKVEALEKQAMARCVRVGQTRQVKVFSFVVSDCEEEEQWKRTH